jgi:hypothetical protein
VERELVGFRYHLSFKYKEIIVISFKGLSRGAVLSALYNAAKVPEREPLHVKQMVLTEAQAEAQLRRSSESPFFSYLDGRTLRFGFNGADEIDEYFYDKANGPGKAAAVIADLYNQKAAPA